MPSFHRPLRSPPRRRLALGLAGSAVLCGWASRAAAQAEAQKPQPNVLLLVDTSGSMEFKTDGTFPNCVPEDTTASEKEKSRWIDLVEVMTGTFENYSCWAQDRSSAEFRAEFSLGGVAPYDFGYVNPYHRAMSKDCLYGPGVLPDPSAPFKWPTGAVNTFPLVGLQVDRPSEADLPTYPGCSGFSQLNDGLLDVFKDEVRFGLMTFDARVSEGTGLDGTTANYETGMDGNWSYFLDGKFVTGHPANCSQDLPQEIGARNAAAPPWEGRMVAFGPPGLADNSERNGWIQQILLSTRPYGATPIAGQLHDAREFLWNDTTTDPLDGTSDFGPRNDPNWGVSNCRKTIMVLLTDGEPNLDLRPFCEADPPPPETAGRCPYDLPEEIVRDLRESPPSPSLSVETYVIGFALGTVRPAGATEDISCAALTDTQCADPLNDDGSENSKRVQACCTLNEIAAAGGVDTNSVPRKAYFANNRAELRAIFTDILDDVIEVATRTMPVFGSPGGDTQSKGFKFFSAFDPQPDPLEPQLWKGVLERKRFVCDADSDPDNNYKYDPLRGDDFAANLNDNAGDRWFYSVIADGGDNKKSIRPSGVYLDGLDLDTGTQIFADEPGDLSGEIPPGAMEVSSTTCEGEADLSNCRTLIVDHLVGANPTATATRCPNGICSLFGGIYHSTPTIVPGRPSELLRDESYRAFTELMGTEDAGAGEYARPSVLYTSTVDGMLHAFKFAPHPGSAAGAVDTKSNNELWAFLPPAVLPVLKAQYPNTPATLLDGVPIIKDVVSRVNGLTNSFERLQADAAAGAGNWRTVLLQGFGEGQVEGGYFALDITDPDRGDDPPQFLWQLTRDASGNPLFGRGGTPLITTVFLAAASGGPREVAVAVLPGGDLPPSAGVAATTGTIMDAVPASFTTARFGRNYTGADRARSLTIVRLDTGEIIKTFRPSKDGIAFSDTVFAATDIPAPITGQPKAFPDTAGAVADRIFVGDRDGRLWRVDVSSQDPANWSMKVFFDAFYDGTATNSEPVVLPPVLSVDDEGNVTVAFATGDQQATAAPATMVNRVVSLSEDLDSGNNFVAKVNWIHSLSNGERVTGPMVLFNRGLYYAASRPPDTSASACDVGSSKVFGADFIKPQSTTDRTLGPDKAAEVSSLLMASRSDGLIFGLSLQSEPSCASAEELIDGNASFGYGNVSMSKQVNPGRFFLTFEVSGSSQDQRGILEVKQQLQRPRVPVTFESWALIYE